MKPKGPTTIDEYLAAVPADARAVLAALRATVRAVAPDAAESISYGMPMFKYRGRPLIYFGAWKSHCAIYGMDVSAHQEELAAFELAKGTIRFTPNAPLPEALVKALLAERKAAIEAAG